MATVSVEREFSMPTPLVSTLWLEENLHYPLLKVIDASWHMPSAKRDARLEFTKGHIPSAIFFNLDAHADKQTDLPHMLPAGRLFAQAIGALGIGSEDNIVVYDSLGLFSAARLWWMLRVFGHDKVSVLDGGLPKWKAEERPTTYGPQKQPILSSFKPRYRSALLRTKDEILENLKGKAAIMLDARSPERFSGQEAEPRTGLRSGHIPGSKNLPYTACLNPDGTLKNRAELEAIFTDMGVIADKPVISSCGSGVTACILDLALEVIGHTKHSVYDGSWAEWGKESLALPVETSIADKRSAIS